MNRTPPPAGVRNREALSTLSERTGLSLVLKRFPEHGETLERLFRRDPSFQSLCQDYRECQKALQSWRQSTARQALTMQEAYVELLGELEEEVRQFLKDEGAAGARSGPEGLPEG